MMNNNIITYRNAVKNNFMVIELDINKTKKFQNEMIVFNINYLINDKNPMLKDLKKLTTNKELFIKHFKHKILDIFKKCKANMRFAYNINVDVENSLLVINKLTIIDNENELFTVVNTSYDEKQNIDKIDGIISKPMNFDTIKEYIKQYDYIKYNENETDSIIDNIFNAILDIYQNKIDYVLMETTHTKLDEMFD